VSCDHPFREIWALAIGISALGKSEFSRSKESGHQKSRKREEESEPSIRGGRATTIRAIGESPDRKSSISILVIGNPGDKKFGHFGIAKSETPIRRKVPLREPAINILEKWEVPFKGPAVSISESRDPEDQESHEPLHCSIEKLETLTRGKTAVMGITIIWARILAKRASV
jgi:hypothetical protein